MSVFTLVSVSEEAICLCSASLLRLQMCVAVPGFYMGVWESKSGLHVDLAGSY